jgi:hypothetical protein
LVISDYLHLLPITHYQTMQRQLVLTLVGR